MEAQIKKDFCLKNDFWSSNPKTKSFLLKRLNENSIGNVLLTLGIPMGIEPAPFKDNLYLYHYEPKYITNLIRTNKLGSRRFHSTFSIY